MSELSGMPFSLLELSPMKENETVSQTLANSVPMHKLPMS